MERFLGSVWAKGGRRWKLRGSRTTAAMGCRGGSSPVAWGGGERAWEDQREATERFPGSAWVEGYRRWWLRWSRGRRRQQRAAVLAREGEGEPWAAQAARRGFGRGVEGEVESSLVKQMEGTREGRG